MKLLPVGTLLLLLAAISACGGDDEEDDASALPDAQKLLSDAGAAAVGLSTFGFELTQENGTIPLLLELDLESAKGSVVVPDRVAAELEAKASGISVSVDAVAIGADTWITNPFTRDWEELGTDLRDFADLAQLLTTILPAVSEPRVIRQTQLDGVETYLLEGEVESSALQVALPFTLPNRQVHVEMWIGVEDSLPRRVRVIGPLVADESDDVVRQIDLYDFDEPVEIEPPV